nr:MAG TPA: hypothetical protein [Caudoviricetes sp.]
MRALCKLYLRKIRNKEMTLKEVPHRWREEVKRLLETGEED